MKLVYIIRTSILASGLIASASHAKRSTSVSHSVILESAPPTTPLSQALSDLQNLTKEVTTWLQSLATSDDDSVKSEGPDPMVQVLNTGNTAEQSLKSAATSCPGQIGDRLKDIEIAVDLFLQAAAMTSLRNAFYSYDARSLNAGAHFNAQDSPENIKTALSQASRTARDAGRILHEAERMNEAAISTTTNVNSLSRLLLEDWTGRVKDHLRNWRTA